MTAFGFCTAEVEEECEEEEEEGKEEAEEDRLIAVAETPSPGGVFRGPLASCWVSLSMLSTVGDRRCLFLCDAPRSAVGGRWGKEEARDWAKEWDGGKRTEEADAREGWGDLVEGMEEGGWLLCKVLFVTFVDCCCCASFNTSREEGKLTGLLPIFEPWPWFIWLAS